MRGGHTRELFGGINVKVSPDLNRALMCLVRNKENKRDKAEVVTEAIERLLELHKGKYFEVDAYFKRKPQYEIMNEYKGPLK